MQASPRFYGAARFARLSITSCALLLVWSATPLRADLIDVEFTGTVDTVVDGDGFGADPFDLDFGGAERITVNDGIRGSFRYDTNAAGNPHTGQPTTLEFEIDHTAGGTTSVVLSLDGAQSIEITNGAVDTFDVQALDQSATVTDTNGLSFGRDVDFKFLLNDPSGTAFSSTALPGSLALGDFDLPTSSFEVEDVDPVFTLDRFTFTLSTLTTSMASGTAVPEPTLLTAMFAGVSGLMAWRFGKRRAERDA